MGSRLEGSLSNKKGFYCEGSGERMEFRRGETILTLCFGWNAIVVRCDTSSFTWRAKLLCACVIEFFSCRRASGYSILLRCSGE